MPILGRLTLASWIADCSFLFLRIAAGSSSFKTDSRSNSSCEDKSGVSSGSGDPISKEEHGYSKHHLAWFPREALVKGMVLSDCQPSPGHVAWCWMNATLESRPRLLTRYVTVTSYTTRNRRPSLSEVPAFFNCSTIRPANSNHKIYDMNDRFTLNFNSQLQSVRLWCPCVWPELVPRKVRQR